MAKTIPVALLASLSLAASTAFGAAVIDGPTRMLNDVDNIVPERQQVLKMQQWNQWKIAHTLPDAMQRNSADFWIVSRNSMAAYALLLPANAEGMVSEYPSFLVVKYQPKSGQVVILQVDEPGEVRDIEAQLKGHKVAVSEENLEFLAEYVGLNASGFTVIGDEQIETSFLHEQPSEAVSVYEHVSRVAYAVYKEAFSNQVVIPDVTTTDDLNWWFRHRYKELGLNTSDHPTVTVQRAPAERKKYQDDDDAFQIAEPPRNGYNVVLRRGDLIFADTGIQYFGLNTDTQQCAYILKPGETDMPEGLKKAFSNGRRFQEIVASNMTPDATASEVYQRSMKQGKKEKLRPELYSHPLPQYFMRYGSNGGYLMPNRYFAGPEIGNEGDGDESTGSQRIGLNTTYALEMDVEYSVPEWGGHDIRMMMETNIAVTDTGTRFLGGRQGSCYLIY